MLSYGTGTYNHPLNPFIDRTVEPTFYLEKSEIDLSDHNDNRYPCKITYWLSKDEIQEVTVVCPDVPYSDFQYDIREHLHSLHGRKIKITGQIQKITI